MVNKGPTHKGRRRSRVSFRIALTLYAISAGAMLLQVLSEIFGYQLLAFTWEFHEFLELMALFGFGIGFYLIWREHRRVSIRNDDVERSLSFAQEDFSRALNAQFDEWNLSEAERDVALFTIKGLTISEIAQLRNTSEGTVKSQSNAIYQKAGVSSRTQLLSAIIEELIDAPQEN